MEKNRFGADCMRLVIEGLGTLYRIDEYVYSELRKYKNFIIQRTKFPQSIELEKEFDRIDNKILLAQNSYKGDYSKYWYDRYIQSQVFGTGSVYDLMPNLPKKFVIPNDVIWHSFKNEGEDIKSIAFSDIMSLLTHLSITGDGVDVIILTECEDECVFSNYIKTRLKVDTMNKETYFNNQKKGDCIYSSDFEYLKKCKRDTARFYTGYDAISHLEIKPMKITF